MKNNVKELKQGMYLYHGSYEKVTIIDLNKCKKGLDFGRGFYVTSSKMQAQKFIKNSLLKAQKEQVVKNQKFGYINIYKYKNCEDVKVKIFKNENSEWLQFIVKNRQNKKTKTENVDIIGGKIANDMTARTLSLYLTGAYGNIGDKEVEDMVIKLLLPNRLKDQYCFLTKKSLMNLEYVGSEKYEIK